jgi:hypothetical protein
MEGHLTALGACPSCGSIELLSEPTVDEDGTPTGLLRVSCSMCGWELGELPPSPASREAEFQPADEVLIPAMEEEPRAHR